ncbi:MAG: hypothetical protein QOE87_4203 [Gaiellales bacterium]|nr:hypothetical protein [Gaiellales bacterium]
MAARSRAGWNLRGWRAGRIGVRAASRRPAALALLVYFACVLAIWRPGLSLGVSDGVVGASPSSDFQVATWSLEWWPWAMLHGINPLHTDLLWAPSGYPTTWITSMPALALLAAPITLLAGPLVSYNVLMLVAPPCAALACYALCRELCGRFWPSLLGGFLFGFSPYLMAQTVAQHLNLVMVWPLPLLVLVALRYCRDRMSGRRAFAASAALLLFLFGTSLELFATTVVLGGIVLAIALLVAGDLRARLLPLALFFSAATAFVLLVAAPVVWLTLATNRPPLPFAPERYATDLANVVVPTRLTLGGTTSLARGFSHNFVGNIGERGGYLGLPLVAVCLIAAWRDRHRRAWIAASAVVVALALSLGPALVIAGRTVADLPFALERLPALELVLPSRLSVFVILAAICLAVPWLARTDLRAIRVAIGIAIAVSLAPHVGSLTSVRAQASADRAGVPATAWAMKHAPAGFIPFASHLAPRTTVLALPFGGLSPASFWQAATDMRFRLAGGYTPFAPAGLATDPLVQGFLRNSAPPLSVYRLRAYLLRTHTQVVLVQASSRGWLEVVRSATGVRPRLVAGTEVFTVGARRLRALLVQPSVPGRQRLGFPLSRRATPIASLAAGSNSHIAVAAWLTWDWRTRHVVAQGSTRTASWLPARTLSDPRVEASDLSVAAGGRRSIVSWIEARNGAAAMRVAEFHRGRWQRIRVPQNGGVAMETAVAAAPDGAAAVAWTTQAGARLVLHAVRIGANGDVSAVRDLSSPPHSVDAFAVAASSRRLAVAWRESDSTRVALLAATLRAGSRTWGEPAVLSTGSGLGTPVVSAYGSGAVIVWTSHRDAGTGLHGARIGRHGLRGRWFTLVAPRRRQTIANPGVAATPGGVLVAWCATAFRHPALHVALVTETSVRRGARPLAFCSGTAPHLLQMGRRMVLNATRVPRLYLLTQRLRCTRLDPVRTGGAYRLVAGRLGVEAISAGGAAGSTVVVRQVARPELDERPCRPSRGRRLIEPPRPSSPSGVARMLGHAAIGGFPARGARGLDRGGSLAGE